MAFCGTVSGQYRVAFSSPAGANLLPNGTGYWWPSANATFEATDASFYTFTGQFSAQNVAAETGIITFHQIGGAGNSSCLGVTASKPLGDKLIIAGQDGERFRFRAVSLSQTTPTVSVIFKGYQGGMQVVSSNIVTVGTALTYTPTGTEWQNIDRLDIELIGSGKLLIDDLFVNLEQPPAFTFNVATGGTYQYYFANNITRSGGAPITETGFDWALGRTPNPGENRSTPITNPLVPGTALLNQSIPFAPARGSRVHVRGYVKNVDGTFYSAEQVLIIPLDPPVVTLQSPAATKNGQVAFRLTFPAAITFPDLASRLYFPGTNGAYGNLVSVTSMDGGLSYDVIADVAGPPGGIGTVGLIFTGRLDTDVPTSSNTAYEIVTVDNVKPLISFMSTPSFVTSSTASRFSLSATKPVRYFMKLDGAPAVQVSHPVNITVGNGQHTVAFYAVDAAGNQSDELSYTYTVSPYPTPQFVSGPPEFTNALNANFTVAADYAPNAYKFWLNGTPVSYATPSFTISTLAPGTYTLEMTAVGPTGVETPSRASYTWTVDRTPPGQPIFTGFLNDDGINTTDRIFSYATNIQVQGTAEPNATVEVTPNSLSAFTGSVKADGAGNWTYTFTSLPPLTPPPGGWASTGISYYFTMRQIDAAGNIGNHLPPTNFRVDMMQPRVLSTVKPPARSYGYGKVLTYLVQLDELVYGFPESGTLTFRKGADVITFELTEVRNNRDLVFEYAVPRDVVYMNALNADWTCDGYAITQGAQGNLTDVAGNALTGGTLTNPFASAGVMIDGKKPVVTGTLTAADFYVYNREIIIRKNFDEVVSVTTIPTLSVMVGSSAGTATFVGGNGTQTLEFKYVVPAGVSGDFKVYQQINAIGGHIQDHAGNTLADPPSPVMEIQPGVTVDAKGPKFTHFTMTGSRVPGGAGKNEYVYLDIHFDETPIVSNGAGSVIEVMIDGQMRTFTFQHSDPDYIRFAWMVPDGVKDNDGLEIGDQIYRGSMEVKDALGNPADLTIPADLVQDASFVVDAVAPKAIALTPPADGRYRAGMNIPFKLKFDEAVQVTGTPYIWVDVGGTPRKANYAGGSGTDELTFVLEVIATMNDADGIIADLTDFTISADKITDGFGNPYTYGPVSHLATRGYIAIVDTKYPAVIAFNGHAGVVNVGSLLPFEIIFDEEISLHGAVPGVELIIGSKNVSVPMTLQPDNRTLRGVYTVIEGDLDTDGIQVGRRLLITNGTGYVSDLAENLFDMLLPATPFNIIVDGVSPKVTGHNFPTSYVKGGNLMRIALMFSKDVVVTGTPVLNVTVGSTVVSLPYFSADGPNRMVFAVATPTDLECGRVQSLDLSSLLNSGTIRDAAGNTLPDQGTVATPLHLWVDNCPPVIAPGQEFTINEKPAALTPIGTVQVTELPDPAKPLTWSISGQTDVSGNGTFPLAIHSTTGELRVMDQHAFNYHLHRTFTAIVTATDGFYTSAPVTVTVHVQNVNEAPEALLLSNTTINEDAAIGDVVGTLTTIDPDAGDTFTYSLVPGTGAEHNSSFHIAGNSLRIGTALNRLTQASYNVRVRATDAGGLFFEQPFVVQVADTSRPVITWESPADGAIFNAPFDIIIKSSEPLSNLTVSKFNVINVTVSGLTDLGDNRYRIRLTPARNEMTFPISVPDNVVQDFAGNLAFGTGVRTFRYDVVAPAVSLTRTSPYLTNQPIRLQLAFGEKVTGADATHFTIDNGTLTSFTATDQMTYDVIVTPNADGAVNVQASGNVLDEAGNRRVFVADNTSYYDGTKPRATLIPPAAQTHVRGPVDMEVVFSESLLTTIDVTVFTTSNATIDDLVLISGNHWRMRVTPLTEGAFSIGIPGNTIIDPAGNRADATPGPTMFYDISHPTATLSTTSTPVTNDLPVTVTVRFSEPVTGFTLSDLIRENGTLVDLSTTDNIEYTFKLYALSQNNMKISLPAGMVSDAAGNGNNPSNELNLVYDATYPVPVISIVSGSPNLPNTMKVLFNEPVTGFDATALELAGCTLSGFNKISDLEYELVVEGLANQEGMMLVTLLRNKCMDLAGNPNLERSVQISYDRLAPVITLTPSVTTPVFSRFTVTLTASEDLMNFNGTGIAVVNGVIGNFTRVDAKTYTFTVDPVGDGDIRVVVNANAARDAGGNGNAEVSLDVAYDAAPPSVVIEAPNGSPVNGPFPVRVVFSEPVTVFTVDEINIVNGTISDFVNHANTTFTATVTPTIAPLSPDAEIKLSVAANAVVDAAMRANTASPELVVEYDGKAPAATLSSTSPYETNQPIPVTLTFDETVYGFTDGDILVTNGTISNFTAVDALKYTFLVTPGADGLVYIDLPAGTVQDMAGNKNAAVQLLHSFDGTGPNAALSATAVSPVNKAFQVKVDFTEISRDFDLAKLVITNGTASNLVDLLDHMEFTFLLTPSADGPVTVSIPAGAVHDPNNNGNTASNTLTLQYDGTRPGVAFTSVTPVPVSRGIVVEARFDEPVSGVEVSDFALTNGSVTNLSSISPSIYRLDIMPTAEGEVTLNLAADKAEDVAGNGNTAAPAFKVTYDASAPTAIITPTTPGPVNGPFRIAVVFSEPVAGFSPAALNATNATLSLVSAVNGQTFELNVVPVANGPVTIQLPANRVADAAGNFNLAAADLVMANDIIPPTGSIGSLAPDPINTYFLVSIRFSEPVKGFTLADVHVSNGTASDLVAASATDYTVRVLGSRPNDTVSVRIDPGAVTDMAGNANGEIYGVRRVFDPVAPTVTLASATTSPTNVPFPVTFTFSEEIQDFDASMIAVTNGSASAVVRVDRRTFTSTITPAAAQGTVTVEVPANMAFDLAGNGNVVSASLQMEYVIERPTVVLATTATTPVNAAVPVTATFSKPVTGFDFSEMVVTNGTISNFATSDNIVYTFTLTPVANGEATIDLPANAAADAAGNGNDAAATFRVTFDATKPGVRLSTPATSPVGGAFDVTATFTENVTGFDITDILAGNATIAAFASLDAKTYTFRVEPVAEGSVTIGIDAGKAQDIAGNQNTAATSLSLYYDAAAPTATITTTAGAVTNTSPIPHTVTFSENVTGFDAADVAVVNGRVETLTAIDGRTYSITITPSGNGLVSMNVSAGGAADAAGRGNTAAIGPEVMFDNGAPGVSITTTAPLPTRTTVPVMITFTEPVTGFDGTDLRAINADVATPTSTDNITWRTTVTPRAEGRFTLSVPALAAADAAGNGNTASNELRGTYDATRPTAALHIQPATGSNYTVTATFSEPVTGLATGGIRVTNGVVSTLQATGANTYTFTVMALAEGNVTVGIAADAATDAAGNGNTASPDAVIYHSQAAPTVNISATAADDVNNSFTVTITFSKPVTGFTAGDVEVTNGAIQNLTASGNRAFTATIIPTRDGEVRAMVRAGAASDAGGKANTASNVLIKRYDGTRPGVSVTTTAVSPVSGAFAVQVRFTEKVNGFTVAGLQLRNAQADPLATTDNITFTTTLRPTGGLVEASVNENAATDDAGNGNAPSGKLTMAHDDGMPVAMLTGRNNPYAFGPFTLTIRLNEPSPDFSESDIHLENGVLTRFTRMSATHYTATVTPQYAGPVLRISIPANRYSDVAGNRNLASNTLAYETLQSYTIENVYPNPTSGRIVVKFGGVIYETMKLQLVSMTGDVVHKVDVAPNTSEVRIDIPASVPDGVYHLMIINGPVKRRNIVLIRP